MPVPSVLGLIVGNHHQVKDTHSDSVVAPGTQVLLASCVRLHGRHGYPQIAHTTRPMTTTIVPATSTRSAALLRAGRKGLKPMNGHVTGDPQGYRDPPCG